MTTRPEGTPVSTQPDTQVNPGAEAPAASTPDTSPPPAPGGEVIAFPAPKVGPQHQTVMLHLMAGPLSRVHAWVEPGAHLGTYTTTTMPTFGDASAEPGDGQRFVFHVPSARRFLNRPYDCEADARQAICNIVRMAEWVGLDLETPDPAELNRRVTAAQLKHPSRAQAIKTTLSFGVLPHALAEQDAAARGEPLKASAAPAASPPPPPPPGGKSLTTPGAPPPTATPKRLEPTSYGMGQGAPPAPPAPSPKKPAKGRGGKAPTKIPQAPVPSAKAQQRPSTIAPAATTPAASAAPTPASPKRGGRVSAASAARGKPVPAPTSATSATSATSSPPSAPARPAPITAPKSPARTSTPSPASSAPEEPKAARAAPRTVKTSTFYPLTPASQHPDYAPRALDPKTPPAGLSAKARASGIPELGGWEQKGEARFHLHSHQLDLVKVEGGWWWAKTGGPPISIGTGYPFGSPTQALSCLQRRYLNRLGWKSGPWSAFAASKGLT